MLNFTKMQGLGNDYVYIDNTDDKIKKESELARYVSNRNFGVGSDGLILICKSVIADFKMRIFNSDGSEAEMCGNGIRCVGKYVYDKKLTNKTEMEIETMSGIRKIKLNVIQNQVETVEVDMGEPIILNSQKMPVEETVEVNFGEEILNLQKMPIVKTEKINMEEPIFNLQKIEEEANQELMMNLEIKVLDKTFQSTYVSMGNPHSVIIVEDVSEIDVQKYGKLIENHKIFPNKTNVEFIQIIDKHHIKMRVWERGSGETLACGTGACASMVVGYLNKLIDRRVDVELLGGTLKIYWDEHNNHVYMTGPAVTVFEGELVYELY